MHHRRTTWLAVAMLTSSLMAAAPAWAGDATASRFKGKASELKITDGKATVTAELTSDDPTVQAHHFKIFNVNFEAGKTYRIEYKNAGDDPKFDPFLFLEDASGKTLGNDDDSAGGLNSKLVYKASKAGVYRVICTTLPPNQTGKFSLDIGPATAAEEKEAAFNERVANFATSPPAEQKKIIAEATKRFQDQGEKLTINDARQAFQLATVAEDGDPELARSTYNDFIKIFAQAENKQVASVANNFRGSLKKLDMLGKEIEVTGKTVDGKEFDLKKMKGKVVLVDFWATWCGPCIAEIPNMESAYKKYHGKGFDIIGVSLDRTDDAIVKFNENRKIPWPSINIEDSRVLADRFGVNAIPFPVLVDANGRVVSLRARGPQLERLLERLLGEKK